MNNKEIKELSDKEISARIIEERTTLVKLRLSHAVSPVENPKKIKESKRLIARLLTEQTSRKLQVQ